MPRKTRKHDLAAAPVALAFAVPPGVAGGISVVRLPRTVPAGGEDVAGRFVAQLVKAPGKASFKIAAHLRKNPAPGLDLTEFELEKRRLNGIPSIALGRKRCS
jgi:hypothetical protein